MTVPPDSRAVDAFLARAAARHGSASAARGAAYGFAAAIILALAVRSASVAALSSAGMLALGASLALIGGAAGFLRSRGDRRRIAYLVERRAPQCRNLVITAAELERSNGGSYVASIVVAQAARVLHGLEPRRLFPIRTALAALVATMAVWLLVAAQPRLASRIVPSVFRNGGARDIPQIDAVEATILPPAYTRLPGRSVHDPSTLDAVVASRIRLAVRTDAPRLVVETATTTDTISRPSDARAIVAELTATRAGYISVAPLASDGSEGARRLIGLTVAADEPPRPRITAPGRDLFLADPHATLDIAAEASDDIGLASLLLKFTKVSGSDERYTFVDGEIPATIARRDARTWTAHAAWRLDDLRLQPGDMVVYRAVATDNRPGATPVESDAFIAELPAPGSEAAAGFSIDPEQDRAAVSQQMVILKTERLLAARPSIAADSFAMQARDLAAEQRKVRSEFVFMLGGELVDAPDAAASMTTLDETAEAEGESDVAAGRGENAGHAALLTAIRAMSRAAAALTTARVDTALVHERTALTQLERAFSHSRIILRALAEREQLDLSRRLGGSLADATGERRPVAAPVTPDDVTALRAAAAELGVLARQSAYTPADADRAALLSDRVLQIDPTADSLRAAAQALSNAAARMRGRQANVRGELDHAAVALGSMLRAATPSAAADAPSIEVRRLRRVLSDALRGRTP